jgi:GWxTD domain-containing protein
MAGLGLALGLSFAGACRLYNLERRLDPTNADFLNKVRYIITAEERKMFLELPDAEKPPFIEEFWNRRNPDPSMKENEFKIEYFHRLETANKLFPSEGIRGWLTDRGRIYILFGPPMDRIMSPLSGDADARCEEVWYYGSFPVVFHDETCTGNYKLVTSDLSDLRDINLMYMHELNRALVDAQRTFNDGTMMFDFDAALRIDLRTVARIEGAVTIKIPYDRIRFESHDRTMGTGLVIILELRDAKGEIVWQMKKNDEILFAEAELGTKLTGKHRIDIPWVIEDAERIGRLGRGRDVLYISLTNTTGNATLKKAFEFK